jgi:putative transposase
MPRVARYIFAGVPHHVTQRGNRRGRVFFSDADHQVYLSWLRVYAAKYEVDVLAYCLMPNHVHLVLVPARKNSLHLSLRCLHLRYAQRVNRAREWKGHLWQGRYFASALDDAYFWAAIRYVELNPLRAGMVEQAEDYPWSSAQAHCGLRADPVLSACPSWQSRIAKVVDWSSWLREGMEQKELKALRLNGPRGLPCGSESFVADLEAISKKRLRLKASGRPRKSSVEIGMRPL